MSEDLYEEASYFDFVGTTRDRLDHIVHLNQMSRKAAEVMIELQDKGALYDYVLETREEALEALHNLVFVDPENPIEITKLQSVIRRYSDVCAWINSRLEDGEVARDTIKEEFGDNE